MPDFIYDFVLITLIGGVIVGLILIALQKIKINTLFFFKFRLRNTLSNYTRSSTDKEKERKYVLMVGNLIDKALKKVNILEKLGFQPFSTRGIGNDKFRLYLKKGFKFTIKDLTKSQAFFSKNFEEATLKKSVDGAIINFIEHLEKKSIKKSS